MASRATEILKLHETEKGLRIGEVVKPIPFKEITAKGAKEKDLEDLIVAFPALLNWTSFDPASPDLLVIARQPRTANRKIADLFCLHWDGSLVIVEVKRDAVDAKARAEPLEFQAIRYAASSRKMTADDIVLKYALYLKKLASGTAEATAAPASTLATASDAAADHHKWRSVAVMRLCQHLESEEGPVSEETLFSLIKPPQRQQIYLVAADFDDEAISACAWLRGHDIKISCFRISPMKIGSETVVERHRLLPPPALDDYMLEMASDQEAAGPVGQSGGRATSDKPVSLVWADAPDQAQSLKSWKDLLTAAVKKCRSMGLDDNKLPMKHSGQPAPDDFISARIVDAISIETNASAGVIRTWVSEMLYATGQPAGFLQVELRSGTKLLLPE